jgi:hypothetical protein
MPQAYGSFVPVNFILTEDVCFECNQFFGGELETPGARASVEGIHRFNTERMMSPKSFLKMPKAVFDGRAASPTQLHLAGDVGVVQPATCLQRDERRARRSAASMAASCPGGVGG